MQYKVILTKDQKKELLDAISFLRYNISSNVKAKLFEISQWSDMDSLNSAFDSILEMDEIEE